MPANKIISFEHAPAFFKTLRARGKRIVQSHGIFDLIHPGHVCHLEEARELGDMLVVTLTADKFVNKGPGRPYFDHLSQPVKSFCETLAAKYTRRQFVETVESFAGLRVLVVGDTIFDRYSYLKVQGLTSKNKIISGRFLGEETQTGGALAVFRHVKQFARNVKFVSLIGAEPWAQRQLRAHVAPGEDCVVRAAGFTTIIKQRFVEPLIEEGEMSKLFSVNFIDAG